MRTRNRKEVPSSIWFLLCIAKCSRRRFLKRSGRYTRHHVISYHVMSTHNLYRPPPTTLSPHHINLSPPPLLPSSLCLHLPSISTFALGRTHFVNFSNISVRKPMTENTTSPTLLFIFYSRSLTFSCPMKPIGCYGVLLMWIYLVTNHYVITTAHPIFTKYGIFRHFSIYHNAPTTTIITSNSLPPTPPFHPLFCCLIS